MRRTHATLMNENHDDPKLVADQRDGKVAVDALEKALPVM